MFDMAIFGGKVLHGTGAFWFYADIGTQGGKMVSLDLLGIL